MAHTFYLGTQDTGPQANRIDLNDPPGGLIRLMINLPGEIQGIGNKAVAAWNTGLFPVVCLKTQLAPTSAQYRTYMIQLLNVIAPASGPVKAAVVEVGNEPHGDITHFLSCLRDTHAVIRQRGLKVILGACVSATKYYPGGGVTFTGPGGCSRAIADGHAGVGWGMLDYVAAHIYSANPGAVMSQLRNQRRLWPQTKGMWLTESGWPSPWGPPTGYQGWASQPINERIRINHILDMFGMLRNNADELNLHAWSYFTNSWYEGDAEHFQECGLVNEVGAIKTCSNQGLQPVTRTSGFGTGHTFGSSHRALQWACEQGPAKLGQFPIGGVPPPPPPPPDEWNMVVNTLGTGAGTVSNVSGISCSTPGSSGDCSEVYTDGQVVNLTATPATDHTFGGWGGAAQSFGTTTTAQVTMDGNKSVSATFVAPSGGPSDPPDPPPSAPPVPSSSRLLEAVRSSHTLAVRAEVLREGAVVAEPPILTGSVSYDAKAAVRATLDMTVADDGTLGWIPSFSSDPLAPYGNEIRVSRGVRFPDGTEEMSSLGIFKIYSAEAQDTGEGLEVRVSGSDRSQAVSDFKFVNPHNVPRGTKVTDVISNQVRNAVGPVALDFVATNLTTPGLSVEAGDDRWEFCQGLAQACGFELYFDGNGTLALEPIPDPKPGDAPVAELVEGSDGVLLEATKLWSAEDAFNVVIVSAENSEINPPVRWTAKDSNPDSPTRWDGPFGQRVRFYSNQFIVTQPQCRDAAEGILRRELGITEQIDFGAVVDPTLRPSDVVLIYRPKLGVSGAHVIDTLNIPLDAETAMTGTTRLIYPIVLDSRSEDPLAPDHLLLSPTTLLGPTQVMF